MWDSFTILFNFHCCLLYLFLGCINFLFDRSFDGRVKEFYFSFDSRQKVFPAFEKIGMAKNTFSIIFSRFMKAIHIELSDKAIDFLVTKILRQDNLLEFVDILNYKFLTSRTPEYYFRVFLVLNYKCYTFNI